MSLAAIGLVALSALGADFIASDKPIVARVGGELYVLPALLDPPALRPFTYATWPAAPGDFALWPLVPWGESEQDKGRPAYEPPSARHWLGTDAARRDVFARLVHGSRVALLVGVCTAALYVALGTLLGLCAAYFGGLVDALVSRLIETLLAVPVFFLVLAVLGVIERAGLLTLIVVMGAVSWTRVARLVRAEAQRVRGTEFVQAARALGYRASRVILRHVLPNCLGPVLVSASFGVASSILIEASLSFLGFGTPDARASWGGLLHAAMGNLGAWWLVAFPGLAIFVTVTSYNLLGDALRDALDPRLHD